MGYKVAVVGATGNVGREMMQVLAERAFPIDEIVALASSRSQGTEIEFGDTGKMLKCKNLEHFDFTGWDIALFAVGSEATKEYAPKAASQGCVVIDNSSLYRMDPDVPLVVPEVNADAVMGYTKKNIIANPNCSTAQMVVALKPLHDRAKIKRVVVSTYQSVSGAGKEGIDELWDQTKSIYNPTDDKPASKFTKQIAFNVIPHIDVFMEDGSTKEEWKMVAETKKILDPKIKLTATCVRVPVFIGHAEAVNVEFDGPVSEDAARKALKAAAGITVVDRRADEGYVTPAECAGEDAVYVSRIRMDPTIDNGLNFWVVADNLRNKRIQSVFDDWGKPRIDRLDLPRLDIDRDDLMTAVSLLRRHHLVLVADMLLPEQQALSRRRPGDFDEALQVCADAQEQQARQQLHTRLRHAGALVTSTTPQQMPTQLNQLYLMLKRSGRL